MKTNFSIGQIIAFVIAAVVGGLGVFCLCGAWSIRSQYDRQRDVRLLDVEVDFSKPGTFSAPFHQTWRACHGEEIRLELPDGAHVRKPARDLVAALSFRWKIVDVQGGVFEEGDFTADPGASEFPAGRSIRLIYFRPIEIGDYEFQCTVAGGAPALAGIEQRLVCQYQPCGMELWPAIILAAIGIPCLLIAGCVLLFARSNARRTHGTQASSGVGSQMEENP